MKQKCDIPSGVGHLERTDINGTKLGNTVEIPAAQGVDTVFYLTYDCAFTRTAIEKLDPVLEDWVATNDIQVPPSSRPAPSGRYETFECYVYNAVSGGLTPGQEYRVTYRDTNNVLLYYLRIQVKNEA